jgi:phosphoribosyl-dephospho-CoA transferase
MFQPHDLLCLQPGTELQTDVPQPDWVRDVLSAKHPVVVRRGMRSEVSIPVGLRGATRGQRFAAQVDAACVLQAIKPESLTRAVLSLSEARREMPALAMLRQLQQELSIEQVWGPTGSVGFELASGLPVVKPSSDLDIVVRAHAPISRGEAQTLLSLFANSLCRSDVSLDTPYGGVSLLEWARGDCKVLLKTDTGPRLVGDPWDCPEGVSL